MEAEVSYAIAARATIRRMGVAPGSWRAQNRVSLCFLKERSPANTLKTLCKASSGLEDNKFVMF